MIASPLVKFIVIGLFVFIVISLGMAFFHLLRDRGESDKVVRALSLRIGLSIALFAFLMFLYAFDLVQ